MEESFLAPAVDDASNHPVWVLLDKHPYYNADGKTCFDDGDNATTAQAVTSGGRTIKVSFRLASPPSLSRFCFHDDTVDDYDTVGEYDTVEAEVISSAKDLVLFRPSTMTQYNLYEYLVYQAACHHTNSLPTLKSILAIHPSMSYPVILPCDDDDREFLIADLSPTPNRGHYLLDIFSSKTNKWVTWPLQLQAPLVLTEDRPPDKLMALGGGAVGWINLWLGILVCNVLDERPVLRFIPLPKPGIDLRRVDDLKIVRDVACCDGIIKFVEMDCRSKEVCRTENKANETFYGDHEGENIIYDSELLLEAGLGPMEYSIIPDGWKIRTCYRHISWEYWRKGHVLDSDDIDIDDPRYSKLLPQLKGYTQRSTLNYLELSYPILSACGGDVVYLCSMTYETWIVGVHLGKKAVEVIENVNVSHNKSPFLACTFSNI